MVLLNTRSTNDEGNLVQHEHARDEERWSIYLQTDAMQALSLSLSDPLALFLSLRLTLRPPSYRLAFRPRKGPVTPTEVRPIPLFANCPGAAGPFGVKIGREERGVGEGNET